MNDSVQRKIIDCSRRIINKAENIHSGELKYKFFYRCINNILKNDFKNTDKFFIENYNYVNSNLNKKIPFKFWIMWWQGVDKAPKLVRKNIFYIKKVMGEQNVVIITKNNYKKYTNISSTLIQKLEQKKISLTTWSDVVRFHILNENGGYWIDSTVIVSHAFKQFLINKTQFTFFTPCESNLDYHYISYGQWAIWLMGGVSHFGLFEYICDFYDCYFLNHKKSIDYFLTVNCNNKLNI